MQIFFWVIFMVLIFSIPVFLRFLRALIEIIPVVILLALLVVAAGYLSGKGPKS